ncbi:MAG: hypothetical protein GTO45_00875 [Candidatus Aminicenantes bacterium]|nr:hypothetical protein [Candidatus Aminicenantes bacterium]NIM77316.1 hypothetical protein [Candidatus Aminicenantes bacterium]NIN16617.1 hypothetical protein [Candidatus Aminicenantes bacterium]NIN40475.1 hypothetical protein [Candidatus Aminicenantes bacterium]NIN83295.1 hypothetical protein [Candidatus Aminicenantes bacterium]
MIRVIRDDGVEILLNSDLVQTVEDDKERNAIITLATGEIIKAKSPAYDIVGKIKAYLQGIKQERKEYEKAVEKALKEKEKQQAKAAKKPKEKNEKAKRG